MSLTFTKKDKSRCVATLKEITHTFLAHGVSQKTLAEILAHIDWLGTQPEELDIDCQFTADPTLRQTQFIITARPGARVVAPKPRLLT